MFARFALILALSLVFPSSNSAQEINGFYADENLTLTICNQDGDAEVKIIIVDQHAFSTSLDGYYTVKPNSCTSFYRDSSNGSEHSVFFKESGVARWLDFDFGPGWRGGSFCVNPNDVNDLFESILVSPGRTTNCRGDEVLRQAPIGFPGGNGKTQEITIPAFSSTASATDGKTCFLGLCL